ncbi:hypothetical protein JXA47_03965 [Candidatus Sumerlaeota bacterium]|nr:hypothetical protein [Candidatus Sumerlaeota bacterium]
MSMRLAMLSAVVLMMSLGAAAQTVSVDAANASPDHTTTFSSLMEAIHSFQADGTGGAGVNHGNAEPDIIRIASTAVIDEAIEMDAVTGPSVALDEPLTIEGDGITALVALRSTGADGLWYQQDVDLTLRDIIFIPSRTDTPIDDLIELRATANAADVTITMERVVVTANDGSDGPVTTDGRLTATEAEAALATATGVGDDAVYLVSDSGGGSMTLTATDLIISAFHTSFSAGDRSTEGNHDGMVVFMDGTTSDIVNATVQLGEGCVISCTPRFGIQSSPGAHIDIAGSASDPVVFNHIHSDGIWVTSDSDSPTQASVCTVDRAIFAHIDASALKEQETFGRGFIGSLTNTIIAHCGFPGIELYASGALPPGGLADSTLTVANTTVHGCGTAWDGSDTDYDDRGGCISAPVYQSINASNRSVDMDDVIISGGAGQTGLHSGGPCTMAIDFSAIVTLGSNAVGAATSGGGTITVGGSVIGDAIVYLDTDDPFSPDFFDVVVYSGQSSPYRTAGTGGAPLSGGGDLVELTYSAVSSWSVYR